MSWTYEATKAGYRNLWNRATIRSEDYAETTAAANKIIAGEARYKEVQAATGVPWFWIGAIHMRESSNNFNGVLHNGQNIIGTGQKTTLVPAGRGPFTSWSEAAIDALKIKNLDEVREWTVEQMLFRAELFNGLGYVGKGVNSPYVWAGTSEQQAGKYVADHVWSTTAWDTQLGVAAVLKRLAEMRPDIATALSGQTVLPPTPGLPAGLEEQLKSILAPLFENFNARLTRIEQAVLPALPPPVVEPAKPPVVEQKPGEPEKPPAKPGASSDFLASIMAAVGAIGLQLTGTAPASIGDNATSGGIWTTLIALAVPLITGLSGSNVLGRFGGGALDWMAARAATRVSAAKK
jgi:lysozyme family protein